MVLWSDSYVSDKNLQSTTNKNALFSEYDLFKPYSGWGILVKYRLGAHCAPLCFPLFVVQLPPNSSTKSPKINNNFADFIAMR